VVALVLLRQKQLTLVATDRSGGEEHMVLARRRDGESFRVKVVDLSEDEVRVAQNELSKVVRIGP